MGDDRIGWDASIAATLLAQHVSDISVVYDIAADIGLGGDLKVAHETVQAAWMDLFRTADDSGGRPELDAVLRVLYPAATAKLDAAARSTFESGAALLEGPRNGWILGVVGGLLARCWRVRGREQRGSG